MVRYLPHMYCIHYFDRIIINGIINFVKKEGMQEKMPFVNIYYYEFVIKYFVIL